MTGDTSVENMAIWGSLRFLWGSQGLLKVTGNSAIR